MALLMYESFIRRDLDALLPFTHDEVELEPRLGALEGVIAGTRERAGGGETFPSSFPITRLNSWKDLGDRTLGQVGVGHIALPAACHRRNVVAVDAVPRRTCIRSQRGDEG